MGPADLTIVVNSGVHRLAEEHLREEVFVASEGSLDLSSPEAIHTEFRQILLRIARKLKSHAWNRVYIIPFGGESTDGEPTSLRLRLRCRVIPKAFESTHDLARPAALIASVRTEIRSLSTPVFMLRAST